MSSPTSRTMGYLRDRGYTVAKVEFFNYYSKTRVDLYGWCDILAIRPDKVGVLGVQATTTSNQAARLTKIRCLPALRTWLLASNRCEIWGWKKSGGVWVVTRRPVILADLAVEMPQEASESSQEGWEPF